jgi:hypothetical protein
VTAGAEIGVVSISPVPRAGESHPAGWARAARPAGVASGPGREPAPNRLQRSLRRLYRVGTGDRESSRRPVDPCGKEATGSKESTASGLVFCFFGRGRPVRRRVSPGRPSPSAGFGTGKAIRRNNEYRYLTDIPPLTHPVSPPGCRASARRPPGPPKALARPASPTRPPPAGQAGPGRAQKRDGAPQGPL